MESERRGEQGYLPLCWYSYPHADMDARMGCRLRPGFVRLYSHARRDFRVNLARE